MLIQRVEIENFRGIQKNEFDFYDSPFVLLSAQNGLGKTTLIDAIEWCLTGTIGRLKNAYDQRSTNADERKKNIDGILKNKKAGQDEKVKVCVYIKDNKEIYKIYREQLKDELKESLSTVTVNGMKNEAFLKKIADNSFYNYHCCDMHKSFGIQSKKRKDMPEMFAEFISDYSKADAVAKNLLTFAEDAERFIEDLEKEKISENEIQRQETELQKYKKNNVHPEYPQKQLYEGEILSFKEETEDFLQEQLKKVNACGYFRAHQLLKQIIGNEQLKSKNQILQSLENILKEKKNEIEEAVREGLDKNGDQVISLVANNIREYDKISLSKQNIFEKAQKIWEFQNPDFTESYFLKKKEDIENAENKVKKLKEEKKNLSEDNKILSALSDLITKKAEFIEYRAEIQKEDEEVICPVCGSALFGKIEEEKILSEASEYIRKKNAKIEELATEIKSTDTAIDKLYTELISRAKAVLDNQKSVEEKKINRLRIVKSNTTDFFEKVKKLHMVSERKYSIEDILSVEFLQNERSALVEKLLDEASIIAARIEVKQILDLVKYIRPEDELENITHKNIEKYANDAPKVLEFSLQLLREKNHALSSRIYDQEFARKNKVLQDLINKNIHIQKEQNRYRNMKETASDRAQKINDLIRDLKDQEYKSVGPNLFRFYKKLTRINTIEDIQIIQEEDQISLVDEAKKNVVNILSNGQISVFMLAYFFAGILTRGDNEEFKVYFIDDLTSCMDDVNMLAFLDLMKYQLLEKDGVMDQIFFATCDERICDLLRYKLDGCKVDFTEIKEKDFIKA